MYEQDLLALCSGHGHIKKGIWTVFVTSPSRISSQGGVKLPQDVCKHPKTMSQNYYSTIISKAANNI